MTEDDWQEYRQKQKGIGGSDVATILGLNPYKTPFTLWLEKTGQIQPAKVENEYVEWGNLLEPVILEKFKKETGFKVFRNNFVLQHDDYDFMIANIDGEVIDPAFGGKRGVLEIKTANERMKNDWIDGVPNHYMLQVQHYLGVMSDYPYAYVAVLIGGHEFKYFLIERDDYVIDKIISAEAEFMRLVDEKIAPEISGHSADSAWIANTYPTANEEEAELSEELFGLSLKYIDLQSQIKELQGEVDYIKNRIKLEAKDYKILKHDTIKISMPTIKKISFNSKQFALDHPDLYEQYKNKESSYRGFTVTTLRGD